MCLCIDKVVKYFKKRTIECVFVSPGMRVVWKVCYLIFLIEIDKKFYSFADIEIRRHVYECVYVTCKYISTYKCIFFFFKIIEKESEVKEPDFIFRPLGNTSPRKRQQHHIQVYLLKAKQQA